MKAGYVQFSPVLGDSQENRARIERLVAEAAGADLVVLPELCNSGYRFASREEALAASEPADGPFTGFLVSLCARHRMFIVSGLCERDGERLYNSAVLVSPSGRLGLYRKMHLFMDEKDLFTPGDLGFPVFDLGAERCRIGILICFDWQFPEVWRIYALKGADLICHPSNLVLPGKAQSAVPVHAMLNRIYVVLANRTGRERDLEFTGRSLVASPSGEVMAQGPAEADEVRIVEFDPAKARDKLVTPRNDLLADRRPEFYGAIVGREGSAQSITGREDPEPSGAA
jgi:predicted amidohydrolase